MPKIPFQFAEGTITPDAAGVMAPLESGSAVGKALSRGGSELETATARLINANNIYEARKAHARNVIQSATADAAFETGLYDFKKTLNDRQDYQNFNEDYQKHIDENLPKILDTIDDPDTRALLQAKFQQKAAHEGIIVDGWAKKRENETIQNNYFGYVAPKFQDLIARSTDPEEAAAYAQQFADYTNDLVGTALSGEQAAASIKNVVRGGELVKSKNIIQADPDAWLNGTVQKSSFLNENDLYNLDLLAERVQSRRDTQLAKVEREATRERYNAGAKEVYDRFGLWANGQKAKDGMNFFTFLDMARDKDLISERTYQVFDNRANKMLERQDKQAETNAQKMTPARWKEFGPIMERFRNPSNNLGYDDIADLPSWVQNNAARTQDLVDVISKRPSKERATVISTEHAFISKKLKDAEVSPEQWDRTMTAWNARLKDTADGDISKLAKELVADLPENNMAAWIKQRKDAMGKKEGTTGGKPQPKAQTPTNEGAGTAQGWTYDTVTGTFKEIGKK